MEDRECHLVWKIPNPFLPSGKQHEIRFKHETLTDETWWEAMFRVSRLSFVSWSFHFRLKCVRPDGGSVVAEKLKITIGANRRCLAYRDLKNHLFRNEQELTVHDFMEAGGRDFCVDVVIHVKQQPECDYDELEELSEDLKTLRNSSVYSDLCLLSNLADSGHRVHSSIIRARWNNFFREHPQDRIVDRTVRMDISDGLLNDILDYMYTGCGKLGNREIPNAEYLAELNQVIEKYELSHLRNFLVEGKPVKIVANVSNDLWMTEKMFPVNRPPFETCMRVWKETLQPDVEVDLQFVFCLSEDEPHFSYKLKFTSPNPVYALVTIKYEIGRDHKPSKTFHEQENHLYFDDCEEEMMSRNGDLKEVRKFMLAGGRFLPFEDRIRFILHVSTSCDNPAFIHIEREEDIDEQYRRLEVLSDHMFRLFEQRNSSIPGMRGDLQVQCLRGIPMTFDRCRREIFTTRVRRWRNVIHENIPEGDPIPEVVGCEVMSTTFRHLLDFIYTGKVFSMSTREVEEFANFASNGQLGYEGIRSHNILEIERPSPIVRTR